MQNSILALLGRRLRLAGLRLHPGFLKFWAAETVSGFGSRVTTAALPLLAALTLDASPAQMGLLSAASTAPFLLIGLFAGVWVDRARKVPLLVASDLARAALLAAIPAAWATGRLSMGLLYAVALGVGALTVVFEVASLSLLPALVGRQGLVEGNGKLEASRSLAQIGGPGLAGWLVGLFGAPLAVLLDAVSYLVSAAFLARLKVPEEAPSPAGPRRVLRDVGEGLRAVFAHRLLRPLVLCSATANLFGFVFLSVYVLYLTDDLGLGPTAVGLVFALGGVGALLGAFAAHPAARRLGRGPAMTASMVLCGLFGMAVPLAVLVPAVALPLVLAAEFAQYLFLVVYRVGEVSARQTITPDRVLGRANATQRFVVYGAIPLGGLLGGLLGEAIGVPPTLVVGMLGMLLASLWLLLSPVRSMRP
jgi:MFS family permease